MVKKIWNFFFKKEKKKFTQADFYLGWGSTYAQMEESKERSFFVKIKDLFRNLFYKFNLFLSEVKKEFMWWKFP